MRFHGEHHFHAFPFLVRSGSLIEAFGPAMGHKAIHPQTGDASLRCQGFNQKNDYDRQTPCDQDYLRQMARDTEAQRLENWFNRDVVGIFKQHHTFDEEGIFLGDATYLFVPNNPRYQGSSLLLFDQHHRPVDVKTLTPEERKRYTWRRCYKLVGLLHTNRAGEFFLYAGLRLTEGRAPEAPVLYAHISILSFTSESSDHRRHQYSCGCERDEDAPEVETQGVRYKISPFSPACAGRCDPGARTRRATRVRRIDRTTRRAETDSRRGKNTQFPFGDAAGRDGHGSRVAWRVTKTSTTPRGSPRTQPSG